MADSTLFTPANRMRPYLEEQPKREPSRINVGTVERWASIVGGGALALFGLSRRSLGGLGLAALGGALVYRGASGHCPVYGTLGVSTAGSHPAATTIPAQEGVKVEKSITINRAQEDLFRFWRNFENLPRIMTHLESVRATGPKTSRWLARGPLGLKFEWDAELYGERELDFISWRSLPGSEVDTAGSVHFQPAPGGLGTEIRVSLKYDPPTGKAGAAIAKLLGQSPEGQIEEDLRRFKQFMETGEAPSAEGRCGG